MSFRGKSHWVSPRSPGGRTCPPQKRKSGRLSGAGSVLLGSEGWASCRQTRGKGTGGLGTSMSKNTGQREGTERNPIHGSLQGGHSGNGMSGKSRDWPDKLEKTHANCGLSLTLSSYPMCTRPGASAARPHRHKLNDKLNFNTLQGCITLNSMCELKKKQLFFFKGVALFKVNFLSRSGQQGI